MLYILTGLPYSGKTTLRRELMKRFNFKSVSVDERMNFYYLSSNFVYDLQFFKISY